MGRGVAAAAVLVLAGGLFAITSSDEYPVVTTTLPEALPPPTPPTTTTTTAPASAERRFVRVLGNGFIVGALPDGTRFSLRFEPERTEKVTAISAAIMADLEDGTIPAGEVSFDVKGQAGASQQDGPFTYRFGDPSYVVEVTLDDEVWQALGSAANEVFFSAFVGEVEGGFPVLKLDPPFRWATDLEVSTAMEVTFETFAVRRGCDQIAVACNRQGGVQVIPLDRLYSVAPVWDDARVTVASQAPRPDWHPSYVDPGPLSARVPNAVAWTGSEMIVWGGHGVSRSIPSLLDGAAYNPETGRWRMLAPAPLPVDFFNRAVWADEVLIAMSEGVTVVYDPETDAWTEIAPSYSSFLPSEIVWAGGAVYLWDGEVVSLDPAEGEWQRLPRPPFEATPQHLVGLYAFGEELLLVASDPRACDGLDMALWDGNRWELLPRTPDPLACTNPVQSVVVENSILVWDRGSDAFSYTPATGEWVYVGDPRLDNLDGLARALVLDGRVLIPADGRGVLYDPAAGTWTQVLLPGSGGPSQMVWTGEEILKWGWTGGDSGGDAWRWRPPEP